MHHPGSARARGAVAGALGARGAELARAGARAGALAGERRGRVALEALALGDARRAAGDRTRVVGARRARRRARARGVLARRARHARVLPGGGGEAALGARHAVAGEGGVGDVARRAQHEPRRLEPLLRHRIVRGELDIERARRRDDRRGQLGPRQRGDRRRVGVGAVVDAHKVSVLLHIEAGEEEAHLRVRLRRLQQPRAHGVVGVRAGARREGAARVGERDDAAGGRARRRHHPHVAEGRLGGADAAEDVELLVDQRGGVAPPRRRRLAHRERPRPAERVEVEHAHVVHLRLRVLAAEDVELLADDVRAVAVLAGRLVAVGLQRAPLERARVELVRVAEQPAARPHPAEDVQPVVGERRRVPLPRRRRRAPAAPTAVHTSETRSRVWRSSSGDDSSSLPPKRKSASPTRVSVWYERAAGRDTCAISAQKPSCVS